MESEIFEKIRAYAQENLSRDRYEHSVRVAMTAAQMCELYGIDAKLGELAGIAHDICKEIPEDAMIELAKKDGQPFADFEIRKPSLLHGRAAAMKIKGDFGISDQNVLDAVANHTCGRPGLCDLGKILFVADKIEPGRPQSTDEYRSNLFKKSLNGITLAVVEENLEYLAKKGKKSAPEAVQWAEELRKS
ncbi:MAG: bis(5'-nucleosyl)-tetraphosphatase (symmetrical) YqeK [Treponema sp.]|nr:bis(5'-nucleosyl)-tetraphosphatase (symmetrical) YqeK [Treponema sp.]